MTINEHVATPSTAAAANRSEAPTLPPSVEPAEEFSVGSIVSRGVALYAQHFAPLTAMTLIILLPGIVTGAAASTPSESPNLGALDAIAAGLGMVSTPLATAAAVCFLAEAAQGRPVSALASLRKLLARALEVLGTAIVIGVAIWVGTMFFLVPGGILMAMLLVTMPALLIEGCTIGQALSRSRALTHGRRFACFCLALLPWLFQALAFAATRGVDLPLAVETGLISVGGVLSTALAAVFAALAYIDLCAGHQTEQRRRAGLA